MTSKMRILMVLAALVPAAASAASIRNSRHDLSNSSTTLSGVKASTATDNEICKFCHTPHKALNTQLVWNHIQTAVTTYTWGNDLDGAALTKLTSGTPLPGTIKSASRRCFACHDGTVAIGSVNNNGGGTAGSMPIATVLNVTSGNLLLSTSGYQVNPASMNGHHPVSIPYAAQVGYNTLTSLAKVNDAVEGDYYTVKTTGCNSASGVCTNSPLTDGRNGVNINLLANTPGGTVYGIECTSCHEPHNEFGNTYFLRVQNTTSSGLCRSCHNK